MVLWKNGENKGFTELEVWKKARVLKIETRILALTFPPDEKYQLSSQIIRSTRSICAAIAEGHGRFSYKDQLHFCIIARGSLSETYNHFLDAVDAGYITAEKLNYFKNQIDETGRLLNGYIKFLRTRATIK